MNYGVTYEYSNILLSYISYALCTYVQCFSMMIILIAHVLMNVSPNSKSSNGCT